MFQHSINARHFMCPVLYLDTLQPAEKRFSLKMYCKISVLCFVNAYFVLYFVWNKVKTEVKSGLIRSLCYFQTISLHFLQHSTRISIQTKVTQYLTTWLPIPYNIMNKIYTVLLIKIDRVERFVNCFYYRNCFFSQNKTRMVWSGAIKLTLLLTICTQTPTMYKLMSGFVSFGDIDWNYFHKLNRAAINMLLWFVKQYSNYFRKRVLVSFLYY